MSQLTSDEFNRLSKQYAEDHSTDPRYLWLTTEQPKDLDSFRNYLIVKFESFGTKGIGTKVSFQEVNKEYQLDTVFISLNNKHVPIITDGRYQKILKGNLSGKTLEICALLRSNQLGRLDIDITQRITVPKLKTEN